MHTLPGASGSTPAPLPPPHQQPPERPSSALAAAEEGAGGGGEPRWYLLTRRSGSQRVSGQVKLEFQWTFTLDGLLTLEVAHLEQLLQQVGGRGGGIMGCLRGLVVWSCLLAYSLLVELAAGRSISHPYFWRQHLQKMRMVMALFHAHNFVLGVWDSPSPASRLSPILAQLPSNCHRNRFRPRAHPPTTEA